MYSNNLEQLTNFLYFIVIGMILSIIFDIFRVLRKSFKTLDVITYIEDIIFGTITGIILLISIFKFNNGELRLYIFIGISTGIIIYMLFISNLFIKLNVSIICLIKKLINLTTKPFIFLFKILKKTFLKPISFICININLLIKKMFYKVKKNTKINKKNIKEEGF